MKTIGQVIRSKGDYSLKSNAMGFDICLNNRVIRGLYFVDEKEAIKEFNIAVKEKTTNVITYDNRKESNKMPNQNNLKSRAEQTQEVVKLNQEKQALNSKIKDLAVKRNKVDKQLSEKIGKLAKKKPAGKQGGKKHGKKN